MTSTVNAVGDCSGRRGADPAMPEVWAGLECTINRVGDEFLDQLACSGHYNRPADIDLLADLGVTAVRYPVLWERHAENSEVAWATTARSLDRLRARGVTPIVGLVHHGSGPRWTSLIDPAFVVGLARFAERVARRFPWIERFVPINEPLTTARFSLLYGLWYPHARDADAFAVGMIAQARATALAMDAIRQVTPRAQLVQTEDLGYTHATPELQYQAAFENERRWLTFDLLLGRVTPGHPLWSALRGDSRRERELLALAAGPCPPDLLGINHYLTSERYLDHRLERFPPSTHGGNGRHRYADVEAIRALETGGVGARQLLLEAWQRYHRPLAVTEVHLGCSREQQLRWLAEMVRVCRELRRDGVDLRAVTAWAAFGSFDWPLLLTRRCGMYESGLFDLRSVTPRPTALAAYVRGVARGERCDHPVLDRDGWWHSRRRLLYRDGDSNGSVVTASIARGQSVGPHKPHDASNRRVASRRRKVPRRLAIVGSDAMLGRAFVRLCAERQLEYIGVPRALLDITDRGDVADLLDDVRPWAIINAAGFVRVDAAERDPDACRLANSVGPAVLADHCVTRRVALVTFSSDMVFGGGRQTPFVESDATKPLNVLGDSQAEAERVVREIMPSAMIIRTSACFGDWDGSDFLSRALAALAGGRRVRAPMEAVVSPTYIPDLVNAALDLVIDGESGIWHLANVGALSWADVVGLAARTAGLSASRLHACTRSALGQIAPRPEYSALGSERGTLMPPLPDAIARYVATKPWERTVRRRPIPEPARAAVPWEPT